MKRRSFKLPCPNRLRHFSARDSGYALLMVLAMMVIMIASSTAVVMALRTSGRRQREEEMVWRGNQYVRAIRLYYHKTGHYPQRVDDLIKGVPGVHFIRQFYKEPMNKGDGSWRFIYVNAAGQIIGSVRYASLQQMVLLDQMDLNGGKLPESVPGLPGVPVSSMGSSGSSMQSGSNSAFGTGSSPTPSPFGQNPDSNQFGQSPQGPSQVGQNSTQGQSGGSDQSGAFGASGTNPLLLQKPTGPVDGPVLGAFITGVGGSADDGEMTSLKIYRHGKKYKDWEFIWNPIADQALAAQQQAGAMGGQQPGQIGTPIGATGLGSATPGGPGGASPTQPGLPQQNQQPQQ
jgi:hypothetical protein